MQKKFLERYNSAKQRSEEVKGELKRYQDSLLLSEADTFIEFCFEHRCAEMKNGMAVLDEWRYHKSQYCQIISTTVYEFHHYSRHDASHSISILEAMEMLIGEDRIVQLSRGDLWLLLEAAYSHDMGMALTGQELCDLWKQEEFKEYLLNCIKGNGLSQRKAVSFYKQMDNLLNSRMQMEGIPKDGVEVVSFKECWPAKIVNYVEWIVADYIRKKHAERMKLARQRIKTLSDSQIPSRLYDLVVVISGLHTEDYSKIIKKLEFEAKGIGAETVHPRFAAAMLRLGDVLDIENNRFSMYDLEHELEIPEDSMLHVRKHEAIKHIHISPEEIEMVAEAEELAVCKETSYWFTLVNREVDSLISNWNSMAPPELKGCTLKPSTCKVFLRNAMGEITEYAVDQQKYFEVNKQKLIQLLVGTNIYDKKLDFIREYLQNAMDAVKMQIWQDIQNGGYEGLIERQVLDLSQIMPYDLNDEIYRRNRIKLRVEIPRNNYKTVNITIEDFGIGMEKECIKILSSLGAGWRKRERYNKIIRKMPAWLKPTGGFGIGIQSAFMVAERVIVETQVQGESRGRRIIMESPQKSGMVSTEDFYLGHCGTRVSIEVPLEIFMNWNQNLKSERQETKVNFRRVEANIDLSAEAGWDLFSAEYIEKYVRDVLDNYLIQIIPNPLVPIVIYSNNYEPKELKDGNKASFFEKRACQFTRDKRNYKVYFADDSAAVWDCEDYIYFEIKWNSQAESRNTAYTDRPGVVCYKSIRMTKERIPKRVLYENFNISINYMGFDAENVLKVHRNEFLEEFAQDKYINHCMEIFMRSLSIAKQNNIQVLKEEILEEPNFLLAQVFLEGEKGWPELKEKLVDLHNRSEEIYSVKKYKLIPIKREDKGELDKEIISDELDEIEIECQEEVASLAELCEQYIKFVRGDVDENGKHINLCMSKRPLSKAGGEKALTVKSIKAWVFDHMEYDGSSYKMKVGDITRDEIYEMIQCGIYVNDYFSSLLAESYPTLKREMGIHGLVQEQMKAVIYWAKDVAQTEMEKTDEEQVLGRMLKSDNNSVILSYSEGLKRYEELCINELPYDILVHGRGPYFISPISKKWKQASHRYDIFKGNFKLDLQQFLDEIMCDEEFGFLVSWVAGHIINEESVYKNNEEAVEQKYKELLIDIYNKVIKKETKKDL